MQKTALFMWSWRKRKEKVPEVLLVVWMVLHQHTEGRRLTGNCNHADAYWF